MIVALNLKCSVGIEADKIVEKEYTETSPIFGVGCWYHLFWRTLRELDNKVMKDILLRDL